MDHRFVEWVMQYRVAIGVVLLLVAYWLPLFLVMPAAMVLSIPEHYGLWGTPDVMRNTRTVRSNAVVRYFTWNGNYHAEHHLYPSIPFHRLPETHRRLRPRTVRMSRPLRPIRSWRP
jgi:fatty acid desaturase